MIRKQKLNADQNGNFDRVEERKKKHKHFTIQFPVYLLLLRIKLHCKTFEIILPLAISIYFYYYILVFVASLFKENFTLPYIKEINNNNNRLHVEIHFFDRFCCCCMHLEC